MDCDDINYGITASLKIDHTQLQFHAATNSIFNILVNDKIWNSLLDHEKDEKDNIKPVSVFIKFISNIENKIMHRYGFKKGEYNLVNAVRMEKQSEIASSDTECFLLSSNEIISEEWKKSYAQRSMTLKESNILLWKADKISLSEAILEYYYPETDEFDVDEINESLKELIKVEFIDKNNPIIQYREYTFLLPKEDLIQIKFKVLYSQPVKQGFLNENTNLVFIKSEDDFLQEPLSPTISEYSVSSVFSVDKSYRDLLEIKPLDFLPTTFNNSLKIGKPNLRSNGLPMFDDDSFVFTCTVKTLESHKDILKVTEDVKNYKVDIHSTLFVPLKTLSSLKVLSGDWVVISVEHDTIKYNRWLQVFGLKSHQLKSINHNFHDDFGDKIAYIDPILRFNLLRGNNSFTLDNLKLKVHKPGFFKLPNAPYAASSLNLARVPSPISYQRANQNSIALSLKDHFITYPRLLCVNDIIAVHIDCATNQLVSKIPNTVELDELNTLGISNSKYKDTVYYKVVAVALGNKAINYDSTAIEGLIIDPQTTKTAQQGSSHSRIPMGLNHYFNNNNAVYSTINSSNKQLEQFISLTKSCLHPLSSSLNLNCSILLSGMRGTGKSEMTRAAADYLGLHILEINCYELVEESDNKTKENLSDLFQKAISYAPCIILLKRMEALVKKFAPSDVSQEPWLSTMFHEQMKTLIGVEKKVGHPIIVVGTCESVENFPAGIMQSFRHEIQIEAPIEALRSNMLKNLTNSSCLAPDISLESIATETAALVAKDLVDLVDRTGILALNRISKLVDEFKINQSTIDKAGFQIQTQDFEEALNKSRAQYSDSIGAPKIPNVTWDDVGGLASVKGDILDTIQLPLQHPELFASGAKKRSGILLYGPPGTGKTLLAKAVATSCALNFFSVKGPELLNMYIGESEANVRRVFQRARDAKPCVIFFDELDSVAPKRGEQGDSGGVMDRIVSQLLAELDGMSDGNTVGEVFVIGATNRPDLLDPALLRPGRFDKMLYLGVPQDHPSQLNIIQALTRKFRLHPDLELINIAEQCPYHFTGADFYALCSDAMLKAMSRTADEIERKVKEINASRNGNEAEVTVPYYLDRMATKEEISVLVNQQDFENALNELKPSVTPSELQHYQEIRKKFASQSLNPELEEEQ
ncbi:AAA-domain-containing protein [Neoconidiobolus thromboides FSU 785]|nr:AAA-domain-containing protein [Neoconidiobolus thromboides FSU 785]